MNCTYTNLMPWVHPNNQIHYLRLTNGYLCPIVLYLPGGRCFLRTYFSVFFDGQRLQQQAGQGLGIGIWLFKKLFLVMYWNHTGTTPDFIFSILYPTRYQVYAPLCVPCIPLLKKKKTTTPWNIRTAWSPSKFLNDLYIFGQSVTYQYITVVVK